MGDQDVILSCFTRFLYNLKTRNIFSPALHTHTKSSVGLGKVENKSSATIRNEITSTNVANALGFYPQVGGAKLLWTGLFNIMSTTGLDITVPANCLFNNGKSAIFIVTRLPYNYQTNISSMEPIIISFDLSVSPVSTSFDSSTGYYISYPYKNFEFNETRYGVNDSVTEFFKLRALLYTNTGGGNTLKILSNNYDTSYPGNYYITSVSALILG